MKSMHKTPNLFSSIPCLWGPDFSGVLGVVLVPELKSVSGVCGTEVNGHHKQYILSRE